MNDVFEFVGKPYSQRLTSHFRSRKSCTAKYSIETPSYIDLKLWKLVPNEYKTIESLPDFKVKIKTWVQRTVLADYAKHTFTKEVLFKFPA